MSTIYLGTPTGGRVHHRTIASAVRDLAAGVVATWRLEPGPFVSANRNAALGRFVDRTEDVMVQVDDDVAWGPGVLAALVAHLATAPVVFAEMPDRQMPTNAYVWTPELAPAPYFPTPYRCEAFGTGLWATSRAFASTLPHFPFDLVTHNGFQRREDLSFSLLLAKRGVRPLCIPNMDVLHYNAERALRPRTA